MKTYYFVGNEKYKLKTRAIETDRQTERRWGGEHRGERRGGERREILHSWITRFLNSTVLNKNLSVRYGVPPCELWVREPQRLTEQYRVLSSLVVVHPLFLKTPHILVTIYRKIKPALNGSFFSFGSFHGARRC